MLENNAPLRSSYAGLLIALLLGLINGLFFVWIIPPWQHYDEPNHFEYAWLLAKRGKMPAPDDYSRKMRLDLARSMLQNGFYEGMDYIPDLNPQSGPAWIGPISQLNNPPLYYGVVALPMRLLRGRSVEAHLVAGRLVSLLFYLATIAIAWGVIREITARGHPLRLLVPGTMALLPGFTDSMTALNNDSAAVALASLCLWGCVRLVRRGANLFNLAWVLGSAALTVLAKETAFMALPMAAAALLLVVMRRFPRRVVAAVLVMGAVTAALLFFSIGDSAGWYRSTSQPQNTRGTNGSAVDGGHVFQLDSGAEDTPAWIPSLFQPVLVKHPQEDALASYTVGAWMWADRRTRVRTPILGDGHRVHTSYVDVGIEPTFHAYTATVALDDGVRLWVSLDPAADDPEAMVYYDGLVLTEGLMPVGVAPEFDPQGNRSGVWGGSQFQNLLYNPSAEQSGLRVSPWLDDLGSRFLPDHTRPSALLSYALDWRGAGWQYLLTLDRLHQTFWGKFGWGHVSLLSAWPYTLFLILTLAGVLGSILWLVRRIASKSAVPWDALLLFGILLVGTWVGTISRGAIYLGITRLYIPVARYAYPAIIPTVTLLAAGWLEWLSLRKPWTAWKEPARRWVPVVWLLVLGLLDAYAIASILAYYGLGWQ
jgi:hypothetical protein